MNPTFVRSVTTAVAQATASHISVAVYAATTATAAITKAVAYAHAAVWWRGAATNCAKPLKTHRLNHSSLYDLEKK